MREPRNFAPRRVAVHDIFFAPREFFPCEREGEMDL
jgi:hypothetical protein